ncbi:proton pump-interactor 1-like [Gossypium hirsutum]|uniref:Proton pump-interactor 1-like n=1 Tax=Gossypium hirsutum TaxID=3635 RepID=A0A1U8HUL2_GOSHI|nr:proton pump-interactor 1-like [Gossypium hirsutum]
MEARSLKKEANLKNTEAITKPAKRKYYEETEKLQMTSNKKRIRSCNVWRNNHMRRWRNLWTNGISNNDEFRKEYLRCNERSTLWRLRTLDGRALGPNEVPPVIRQAVNGRAFVGQTMSGLTSKDRTQEEVAVAKAEKVLAAKVVEKKKFMQSAPTESVSATASNGGKIKETEEEKPNRTEEEESDRKAEELSKEDEVAKSKDQRRLEEVAKAKEALERKRRKAENAQAREAKRDANEAVAKPPQNSQHCQHRKKTSTEETKNATVGARGSSSKLQQNACVAMPLTVLVAAC